MKKQTLSVIGKPLRKIDAMAKCAGETIFADDLNLPRMIYAKLLRSPHPHARILGINIARLFLQCAARHQHFLAQYLLLIRRELLRAPLQQEEDACSRHSQ